MRISESKIRQIIREETARVLREEADAGFDGPGVGEDAVDSWLMKQRLGAKSFADVAQMVSNYSEIVDGQSPPGVAQHYPGWNRDDFASLIGKILIELGASSGALQAAMTKL
jgi:hypothetical protein